MRILQRREAVWWSTVQPVAYGTLFVGMCPPAPHRSRRHEQRPIILTTNKPFAEWNEVFPNSSSVTVLVDRLVHRAEIVKIEGQSYRAKEAQQRAADKARKRSTGKKEGQTKMTRRSKN